MRSLAEIDKDVKSIIEKLFAETIKNIVDGN